MLNKEQIQLSCYSTPKACINCKNSILHYDRNGDPMTYCLIFEAACNLPECGRKKAMAAYYTGQMWRKKQEEHEWLKRADAGR
jgi:hypothetical protein